MLVLSRKVGQKLVCVVEGKAVWITVTQIVGGKCRLGIEAPTDVKVFREEVLDRLEPDGDRQEQKSA